MSGAPSSVFLGAFVDELLRLGVRDVVVSPGSRSTPLAMVLERSPFNLYVDIDERGAAYFALGMAKAAGTPVCLLCTSGTAAANYYPAICEAAAARVPLIVLTADRPHQMRGLGATQTTDQLKMFGDMTVFFHEMPLPAASPEMVAFARQIARESVIRATGVPNGVAHLNFPFTEPLVPDLAPPGLFSTGRRTHDPLVASTGCALSEVLVERINAAVASQCGVIMCGEGSYPDEIVDLARRLGFPVLADPLSNLRQLDDPVIIDSYDNIFRRPDLPGIDVLIRFGRYPVSKAAYTRLAEMRPLTIVVDEVESRDFNHLTDIFVRADAASFISASAGLENDIGTSYIRTWATLNEEERVKIEDAHALEVPCEGSYVLAMIDEIAEGSLLFAANSMAVRYVDTFYLKRDKPIHVMCNRGLNGIDGTLSSALGAAQRFPAATLLTGDLAFLHDVTALNMRRETRAALTVVLLNNNGGGIFEMLPQRSEDPYFERLFVTPHDVDFAAIAAGFGIAHAATHDVPGFVAAYREAQGLPGITVVEVRSSIAGLRDRYLRFC